MNPRRALLLAAALVLLIPTPAHADVRKHRDAVGDVQYWVNTDPANVPPPVAIPARTSGDITAVRVTHGTKTVQVVTYFRSLTRTGDFQGHVVRIVTARLDRRVQVVAGPGERQGWAGNAAMLTRAGNPVACHGLKHVLDYGHRRLVLTVPRACVGKPQRVRTGVGTVVLAGDRTYFDDGFEVRGTLGEQTLTPTLGPAVAR